MRVLVTANDDILKMVADFEPLTGEVGAGTVLKDYTLTEKELDEEGYVAVFADLGPGC